MAVREILVCGDPCLRRKSKPARGPAEATRELLDDLVETMLQASGVGLAAPQIGHPVQAIVVRPDVDPEAPIYRLLNPRVERTGGVQCGREGCLSLPTLYGEVERPEWVCVRGLDLTGREITVEGEGLVARALLHEMDHLRGVLFIDRLKDGHLVWLMPDSEEEDGVRLEPTTLEEAQAAFDRLRSKNREQGGVG